MGPRPILLRATILRWTLPLEEDAHRVFEAAEKIGKEHRLRALARQDQEGILLLEKPMGLGKNLDAHCSYPVINYNNWLPMETYAMRQRDLLRRRGLGESKHEVGKLDGAVVITIRKRDEKRFEARSYCRAKFGWRKPLEAASMGHLEKAFLEELLRELGVPAKLEIPRVQQAQPRRTNPTHDLFIAEKCWETGVVVDRATGELACWSSASESSGITARVLQEQVDPSSSRRIIPLEITVCGGSAESAAVATVNGSPIEAVQLTLSARSRAEDCERARALLDLTRLAPYLERGNNSLEIRAGELSSELILEVDY